MGTHPIFESDFDCLTDCIMNFLNCDSYATEAVLARCLYIKTLVSTLRGNQTTVSEESDYYQAQNAILENDILIKKKILEEAGKLQTSLESKTSHFQNARSLMQNITEETTEYYGVWVLNGNPERWTLNPAFIIMILSICLLIMIGMYFSFSWWVERELSQELKELRVRQNDIMERALTYGPESHGSRHGSSHSK